MMDPAALTGRAEHVGSARRLAVALQGVLAGRAPSRLDHGSPSAVILLLYDRSDAAHLLLTRRTDTVASHRGQVCLPGGRLDPADAGLIDTALRETREELGIPPASVRLLGALDDVHTIATGYLIRPFVGILDEPVALRPSPDEIARVIEVPVGELLAADRRLPPSPNVRTLRYPLDGEDVWGATARILRDFCARVRTAVAADAAAPD